jgi:hypothetical protein
MDSWLFGNKGKSRGSALRVVCGSDYSSRLVQEVIHRIRLNADRDSVDLHNISVNFDSRAEHNLFAVHLDSAIGNEIFADTTATETCSR